MFFSALLLYPLPKVCERELREIMKENDIGEVRDRVDAASFRIRDSQ
jgi:hypothetical protein